MLLRTIVLVGAALAALTADAKPPAVSAPGGMLLGQSVDDAVGSGRGFFYGNTCYGELAVSGAVMTPGGLVHVMGFVDSKTQTIDAIEVDFIRQVAADDIGHCRDEVRRSAQALFPGIDWQSATQSSYFLGGADRTYMSRRVNGLRYEVWGDFESVVGTVCTVSWRVASEERTFDAKRVPAF